MANSWAETGLENHSQVGCLLCKEEKGRTIQKKGDYSLIKCCGCGLIHVDPLPNLEQVKRYHDEKYFTGHYEEGIEEFYRRRGIKFVTDRKIIKGRWEYVKKFCRPGRILDVGMGQGLFVSFCKEEGWEAWGTDINKYVIDYHQKNGVKAACGFLEELDLPEDYFDVVTFWQVLEHTINPLNTLERAFALLKDKGVLFIAVPNIDSPAERLRLFLGRPFFGMGLTEMHLHFFSPRTVRQLVEEAGFQVQEESYERVYNWSLLSLLDILGDKIFACTGLGRQNLILLYARKGGLR